MTFDSRAVLAAALLGMTALVAACSENRNNIYTASVSGGDYAVLSCEELGEAQLSIRQRLGARGTSATDNGGLLVTQQDQLAAVRVRRNCPGGAVVEPVTPRAMLDSPAEPAGEQAVAAPDAKYLQVGTFVLESNADRVFNTFRAAGIGAETVLITLGGKSYQRVIVGPLNSRTDIARADKVAAKLGLRDTFFARAPGA